MKPQTQGATELAESQNTTLISDPPSPYAEAGRKFDSLEQWAKDSWIYEYAMFVVAVLTALFRDVDPKIFHTALIIEIVCGLVLLATARLTRYRFERWRCPQCRAQWPGKKLKKESSCAMCGLKLHQMKP